MPTYEYACKKCGYTMEEFQSITAPPLFHCPNCDTDSLVRTVSAGGGVIFKGSGFYQTDYKKSSATGGGRTGKSRPEGEKGDKGQGDKGQGDKGQRGPGASGEGKKEKPDSKENPAKGTGPAGPKKD